MAVRTESHESLGNTLAKAEAERSDFPTKPTNDMSDLLDKEELKSALKKRPEWDLEGKAITRVVEFEDFMEGIDFVNLLADIAEEAQHHPDITINYTKITISLTTHEAGGITEADIELADRIGNLVD